MPAETDLEKSLPKITGVATVLDYLFCSMYAYEADPSPKDFPNRWKVIADSTDVLIGLQPSWLALSTAGFFAVAYESALLKCIIIAVRGTTLLTLDIPATISDLISDFNIMNRSYPATVDYLEKFYNYIATNKNPHGYTISFTGHSLGALLAEFIAYKNGLVATTFESPGSLPGLHEYQRNPVTSATKRALINGYLGKPNWINSTNKQLGRIIHIEMDEAIIPTISELIFGIVPTLKAILLGNGIGAMLCFIGYFFSKKAYNNLVGDHALANFKKLTDHKAKMYLFHSWPPPSTSLWDKPTYLRDKETVNIFSLEKKLLHPYGNFGISSQWDYSDAIGIIQNPATLKVFVQTYAPSKAEIFEAIASKLKFSDTLVTSTDISVLDIEPAFISLMATLPPGPIAAAAPGTRVALAASSVARLPVGDRSVTKYRCLTAWSALSKSGFGDILVLADGKILTSDFNSVSLWDLYSANINVPVKKWGIGCGIRDATCAVRLIPTGNYILVASEHFCNMIVLSSLELIPAGKMGFTPHVLGRKFVAYKDNYIIHSPAAHNPDFKVWNLQTGQLELTQPVSNCAAGFQAFYVLNESHLVSTFNMLHGSIEIWRIHHTEAGGIREISKAKEIKGNIYLWALYDIPNYSIANLGSDGVGHDNIAVLYGVREEYEKRGIAIFNTDPASQAITQIPEPGALCLFNIDDSYFLTIANRAGSSNIILKLWNKETRTAEKTFTWDCFVGKFTSATIQQVIKTPTDFLIISTLYGVIMWDIPSGTQVILEDHISRPKARHGRRANKIAQFADGKLIFSTLEAAPGSINNLFLYDFR